MGQRTSTTCDSGMLEVMHDQWWQLQSLIWPFLPHQQQLIHSAQQCLDKVSADMASVTLEVFFIAVSAAYRPRPKRFCHPASWGSSRRRRTAPPRKSWNPGKRR